MPFPAGRVGLREFTAITGISRSDFFENYRWSDEWIDHFDICLDEKEHLNMSEAAARRFAGTRKGRRATGRSPRSRSLGAAADVRACPFCAEEIKVLAKVCKHCGREIPAKD